MRKWDKAFHIYVMIYCQANPNRSSEILQYVDVIHNASMNYAWDNVATYDFTFRQLMASKPWQSWAKTYSQGWNIALKGQANMIMPGGNQGKMKQGTNFQTAVKNWRENCCWKYNKNRCKNPIMVANMTIVVHIVVGGTMPTTIVGKGEKIPQIHLRRQC